MAYRWLNSQKTKKSNQIEIKNRVTLKAGITERRNDGMAESRNGGKSPQILKDGFAESRNSGKYPQILKNGIAESQNGGKYPPNPKRRNNRKSTEILKDRIV